jgi:aspartate/glutamate racemase
MAAGVSRIVAAGAPRAGVLHTVPALAGTFQHDIARELPGVDLVHIADPWLLQTAIDTGVTDEVRDRLAAHVDYLIACGAQAVLVTCSSVGEAVEAAAARTSVPVLRVDAPMAADAVDRAAEAGSAAARAGRIVVLATLQATLGPTGRLIERAVGASGFPVSVTAQVVDGAIAARDAGKPEEHDRLIREAVELAAGSADVIVLAQASMARAAEGAASGVPVLTSPAGGVRALVAALHGA